MSPSDFSPVLTRQVECFDELVKDESWKRDHEDANACWELEQVLQFGLTIYRLFMKTDEVISDAILSDRCESPRQARAAFDSLLAWWLRPCETVNRVIRSLEDKGYMVEGAAEFRKHFAEAKWMLTPADKAFAHDRVAAVRDNAIDEHRTGRTVPLEKLSD